MKNRVAELEQELSELKKRLAEARRNAPRREVKEYTFAARNGQTVSLSELFGDRDDLLVIHNMGRSCPYCTLWADGFIGLAHHIENRAAFAMVSPDSPETQAEFAAGRGWKFRMVSDEEKAFTDDMGYLKDGTHFQPGVSAFHKDENGKILRTGTTWFGPGDDFCSVWAFLDLLAEGANGWEPKYSY
ncbi:MAG: DUF899 family protein [Armatimonadetes bacterium]|nr:DUF899 family protein [Armatimonadota bacterium]